jgi:ribosomal protein S3AE
MAKKPIKKKYFEVDIPLINEKVDVLAYTIEELEGKSVKMDMTRKLRGKSVDLVFRIKVDKDASKDVPSKEGKATASPKKLTLLPFFIRHMLRKSISYVEDSIKAETKESHIIIKPFLITRKKVSRAVCKTLRNSANNWLVDYAKTKNDDELFEEILSGKLQKPLSLKLKKIYPLSLCEIRILEVKNPLEETKIKKEEK